MIDDLNRLDIGEASSAFAATQFCYCECGCKCGCTQCQCSCPVGDYGYDQDSTFLSDPWDRADVNANPETWAFQMVFMASQDAKGL